MRVKMNLLCRYISIVCAITGCICNWSCTKQVHTAEFADTRTLTNVTNLDAGSYVGHHSKSDGGSLIVHNVFVGKSRDVEVSVMDAQGRVLRTTTFGGTQNDAVVHSIMDDFGNVYIVGETNSPELRMDTHTDNIAYTDAYIAKVDPDGNLLWQKGYCDLSSPNQGMYYDGFGNIALVNGRLYCTGLTRNWRPTTPNGVTEIDSWMVVFDPNGNKLNQYLLPSASLGASSQNFGGQTRCDAIKLMDNNLMLRFIYCDYLSQGREMDTSAVLVKFNTATDQVIWTQYQLRLSPYGDITNIGQLANGNIVCFDSYFNSISIFDINSGNPISHTVIGNNTGSATSVTYSSLDHACNFLIGENYYMLGWMNIGGGITDPKPWLIKLDKQGTVVFNKVFSIQSARYLWMREGTQNTLLITGSIAVFGTAFEKIFTMGINSQGAIINTSSH